MKIERVRPTVLRVTLAAYELASLTAAARLLLEGGADRLTPEAEGQLRQVLARYETEMARLRG